MYWVSTYPVLRQPMTCVLQSRRKLRTVAKVLSLSSRTLHYRITVIIGAKSNDGTRTVGLLDVRLNDVLIEKMNLLLR